MTARFAGLTAEATIFVLPDGTFRLSGSITAAGVGLGGVAVTVIQGVGEGIAAQTTASGEYALYGVGGALRIRASKQGFLDRVQQIDVSRHEALSFELTPGNSRDGMYSGPYTLIITAGRCSGAFPEAGKRRVYTADVQQAGASLRVSLGGADFWTGSGVFAGEAMPAGDIRFTIRPEWAWDYDAFDWIERLPDGTSLIVQGAIVARGTTAGISGVANHESDAGNALHVRVNAQAGSWCYIDRFDLVPH